MKTKLTRREYYRRKYLLDFRIIVGTVAFLFVGIVAGSMWAQREMMDVWNRIDNLSPMVVIMFALLALVWALFHIFSEAPETYDRDELIEKHKENEVK